MRKRAAIARAMALDPEILFLDEPSAGLDPISSRLLDDLILELRDSLGMTIVIVTHELASIFAVARQLGLSRRRDPDDDRHRSSALAARAFRPAEGAGLPHPRASRSARHERTGSPSPRAIGLFVLGGIVLAVLGLIVFGGSRCFSHGDRFIDLFRRIAEGAAPRRARDLPRRRHRPGRPRSVPIYDRDTGAVRVPVHGRAAAGRPGAERRDGRRQRRAHGSLIGARPARAPGRAEPAHRAAADRPGLLPARRRCRGRAARAGRDPVRPLDPGQPAAHRRQRAHGCAGDRHARSRSWSPPCATSCRTPTARASSDRWSRSPPLPTHWAILPARCSARWPISRGSSPICAPGRPACRHCWRELDLLVAAGEKLIATGDARVKVIGEDVTKLAASVRKVADQAAALIARQPRGTSTTSPRRGCRRSGPGRGCYPPRQRAERRHPRHAPGSRALLPRRPRGPGSEAAMTTSSRVDTRLGRRLPSGGGDRGHAGGRRLRAGTARPGTGAAHLPADAQEHLPRGSAQGRLVSGRSRADRPSRTLDTNRIAVVSSGTEVDYVALAFWIDRAPAMVQALIVQSFQSSGRLAQVGNDRDRLRPQFLLRSDLLAFQFNRDNGAQTWCACGSTRSLSGCRGATWSGSESFAAEMAAGRLGRRRGGGSVRRGAGSRDEGTGRLDRADRRDRGRRQTVTAA